MECTTNVNSLLLHCNLGDKLGNANATPTAATSPTKPIAVPLLDGETPCDVDLSSLPFCDDDEDEIFFGQVSGKEHRKAQKFEDRQTALFVQGFRSDRRLMRYTIEMKRSQCDAGTYDEECVSSEYEHGTKHNLGETLSSICEENEQDRVSETHAGVDPGKVRQSFTECDMGVSERHCCLIRDTNSLVTAANVADETRTDHDVCSDDGHQENEDLVMGNSEACGSEKHEDACNLLHFFASVCDLEPHQDDCRRNVKDDIVMLEKKTRDTESDRSGDRVTVNDMSSTDETSISDASRTDDSTDDSRYDDQQNVSDSDDSDALTIDMGCGDETKTCGLEADVSEHEVNVCVSHVSDTDMNGGAKLNTPDAGCSHNNCGESETDVSVEADGADDYSVVENEVNKSGTDLKSGMSESDCIHEYLESDTDEEVVFGSVRNSEKRGDGYTGGTCEVDGVNIITCEISQMQLNTESSGSVGSGSETVIDVTRSNVDNLSDSGHSMNGHDACDSVRVKSSDAVCERHVPVECVSKHDQSGSKGVGDVTMPGSSQSSAECLNAQHSSGPGFNEQSNDVNTPIVALQQIHNPCCSAFQTYRKRDVAEKCEKHAVDLSDGAEITCINGSKEISVKLDFDSVVSKMEYTDASSVSPVTAVTSFACVTPNVTHGPGEFSELSHKVATTTPTFIPPTPQTTSMLICRPVCSCHGDSVREAHSTVFQDEADLPQQACSLVSNHSISCFESQGLSVSRDRQALDMNLHMMGQNNHTLATKCSCQPLASTPISGRIFAATVLQESPKVVAMVTSAGSRNPATSPSVVFTEKHFSPTLVSSSQFCEESPFGGNLRPGVSNDEDGDDIVPPTPKVQHSPHLVVFAEKHYSPMSVGRIDSDLCNHGDTVDNVVIPDATSEESPRIIFKVNNFSPVVIKNNTLPQRVPSREKTCGSTKCEHCVTVVHGDYVSSSRITGKTRSLQRVNKLKLKKGNSIKKGPDLPQCSWKKTPKKFNTGSSTVTLNHSKQRPRPSPLPVLLRKPTSESKSRVRPVNGSHLSTPSRQPPVYRLGTPRHRVVSPGSTLTKATRLASPGTTLTKATRLASQSSTGHHQLPKRTQTDCNEVSEEKSQLKQLHCSRAESAGKPSAPWGAVKATYSPGAPKLLRMHESPMTPTSADNLPRVRYKEKNLNQVQLDAITQLHTLCNSQQAVRYITRPRVGGAVKRVPGKVCSRLSWQDDTLSHVPDDKHAPPSLALSPSPRSILHVKPLTELYPYSDEPLSPVVIHKAVRKTNTLAMAANKC